MANIVTSALPSFDGSHNSKYSGGDKPSSNVRSLVNPEYSYDDDMEGAQGPEWNIISGATHGAIDSTDAGNKVFEADVGGNVSEDSGFLHCWSELRFEIPTGMQQVEAGFDEFVPSDYTSDNAEGDKTIGIWGGDYGTSISGVTIASENNPRIGGSAPSLYCGGAGRNFGHIQKPEGSGAPLMWKNGQGSWHKVQVFYSLAEGPGQFGFFELYVDGALILDSRDPDLPVSQGDNPGVLASEVIPYGTVDYVLKTFRVRGWTNGSTIGVPAHAPTMKMQYDNFYLRGNTVHGATIGGPV